MVSYHDRVLFVERASELRLLARLNITDVEPQRKRVLRGQKLIVVDPKPCDLSMGRVKLK